MITEDILDDILRQLESARDRQRQIQTIKANAEVDAIQREAEAYCGGVYAAIQEIKRIMAEEETCTKN